MKKVISVLLCVVMLFGMLCMPASALSKTAGLKALQGLFVDGHGYNFDYVFYSPVKSDNDKTKYPLIIWLHGQFSSVFERQQLTSYNIAYWACDEYQSRIRGTGGAFLYLPRDPNIDIPGVVKAQSLSVTLTFSFQDIQKTLTPTEFM